MTVPSLLGLEDDGDVVGHSVNIKIQIQYNGGGYNDVINDTISGKSSNRYQRDYLIDFTGSHPVDVRMVRVSATKPVKNELAQQSFKALPRLLMTSSATQTLRLLLCVLIRASSTASRLASI